ncbi:MAG: endo alpha-1,4 polygalactosaminidase [archaeon]|nr:endo alpha-1,4 polygalactosaminidase [archaeon]
MARCVGTSTFVVPSVISENICYCVIGKVSYIISANENGECGDSWSFFWSSQQPSWLAAENPVWPGNYKVRYWDSAWQKIIYGSDDADLDKILDAGFDGVYLDIIDAYEYFEQQ